MRGRGALAAVLASSMWVLAAAASIVVLSGCASCQSTVRQASLPPIAAGSYDGVATDPGAHRLYLANRTTNGVDVVDISSAAPRFAGTVDVGAMPSGLALAPERHRLYAALAGGTLAVIDTGSGSPTYMQVINRIPTSTPGADLLEYSPSLQRVFVSTGQSGELVAVSTVLEEVKERITLNTHIAQPRYDAADGMLYVTAPNDDALLRINPGNGRVVGTIKVKGCHGGGLAINPARQLAMTTCRGSVAVVNLRSGAFEVNRVVAGGDLVTYDRTMDRFVVASPHDKTDSTVGVFYGDGTFLGSVRSDPVAHGAAFDAVHGLVYAPAAAGLMAFAPGACEPPPDNLKFAGGMSFFLAPLLGFALFLVWYARRLRNPPPPRPSWEELQKQDLANERERMRALEDAILGPQTASD